MVSLRHVVRSLTFLPARLLALLLVALACATTASSQASTGLPLRPSVAFYYGAEPPWDELAAFDAVVLEPGHFRSAHRFPGGSDAEPRTSAFAYVSVGEVHPTRAYFRMLPEGWRAGANTAWGSIVVDQTQPDWPRWFVEHAVKPLWDQGYRGFFLDTLDSFHLVAKNDAERAKQAEGLARTIAAIKQAYPDARLIFNRGFEVLPATHGLAWAVAAESLFQGWNAGEKRYTEVTQPDRDWLLGQLRRVQDEYRLPVIAIDYVDPVKRELARATAARIRELGFVPWVATPELDSLGVGAVEVLPRKVLMLYDRNPEFTIMRESVHRYGTMPLNWMGYTAQYHDVAQALPSHPLAGRYAGVVLWLSRDDPSGAGKLQDFLARARAEGVRIAVIGSLGAARGQGLEELFGLRAAPMAGTPAQVVIDTRDAMVGLEAQPLPNRREFFPLEAAGGTPLLRLRALDAKGAAQHMDAIALMPWGGYALDPYALMRLPAEAGFRWIVDPFAFYKRALALPEMPAPDLTTDNGRRMMLVHIDGDGFPSRAELPGAPYAGEVMLREFIGKYRVPHTVSVIEAEVSAGGLYAAQAPALEDIARRIFALPHVEIASHTYTHPFFWRQVERGDTSEARAYSLKIPGYSFDAKREIAGSASYIDTRLAPAGKKTAVLLWSGNCDPGEGSVGEAYAAGLLNMNGGDTLITRADPSLTRVSPVGVAKGAAYQVYAPNQNENVYTNLWTGPYYGYERAIETFELTGAPRRLKPINIYYHAYSATKRASMSALDKVYRWALAQPVNNLHASDYIRKVHDFNTLVVARVTVTNADGAARWLVRGAGELRELRLPAALGHPVLDTTSGLTGYNRAHDQHYLHMARGEAQVTLSASPSTLPYVAEANGRTTAFERGAGMSITLAAHAGAVLALANASGCDVRAGGRVLAGRAEGSLTRYENRTDGPAQITARCR